MTVGHVGKTTNRFRDVVGVEDTAEREDMWGAMPGEIVSFDPATQTATVRPLYKPRHNGESVQIDDLQEIPVRFPRIGGFVMTSPVKEGDRVTLQPGMRNAANFHEDDGAFEADDARSFALSDMEAHLAGGEGVSRPIPNFNAEHMELRSESGDFAMMMTEDGKFQMRGAMGDWFDLMAQLAQALADDRLVIAYGSSAGSGHALSNRATYAEIAGKLAGMKA